MFPDIFTEMAVLLLLAAGVGAVGVRLRQPLIVACIAVGILVGPSVLGWVSANDQIDLLVMGTVCRTGLAGFIIGNTAEEVLSALNCSVLTVKPEGFVSPVTLEG